MTGCLGNGPQVEKYMSSNSVNKRAIEALPGAVRDEIIIKTPSNSKKFKLFLSEFKKIFGNDRVRHLIGKKALVRCRNYSSSINSYRKEDLQNPNIIRNLLKCYKNYSQSSSLQYTKYHNYVEKKTKIAYIFVEDDDFIYVGGFAPRGRYVNDNFVAYNYSASGIGIIIKNKNPIIFSVVSLRRGTIRNEIITLKDFFMEKTLKLLEKYNIDYELSSNSRFTLKKEGNKTYLEINSFTY